MKPVSMLYNRHFWKLGFRHIKILGLAFTLLLIFSPVVQAQGLLANWDFTGYSAQSIIPSSNSPTGYSATLGTNNPHYTCTFWNGVEGDEVYRIRNAGVVNYDPQVPYQGYIYIAVNSDRPWRLHEIRADISENANAGPPYDIPVDVNVEYSANANFVPYEVLDTETVNGVNSCVFNGPISFPSGTVYIRFRSTSDMWCSPYLGVDNVQIWGFLEVAIDIKPGSDPNCFNINGNGVIPVAILGSADFNVQEINPATLLFDGLAVRVRGNKGPLCHAEDTNSDSFLDLVCQFEDDAGNWVDGDTTATLTGNLWDGSAIGGTDSICIVP